MRAHSPVRAIRIDLVGDMQCRANLEGIGASGESDRRRTDLRHDDVQRYKLMSIVLITIIWNPIDSLHGVPRPRR